MLKQVKIKFLDDPESAVTHDFRNKETMEAKKEIKVISPHQTGKTTLVKALKGLVHGLKGLTSAAPPAIEVEYHVMVQYSDGHYYNLLCRCTFTRGWAQTTKLESKLPTEDDSKWAPLGCGANSPDLVAFLEKIVIRGSDAYQDFLTTYAIDDLKAKLVNVGVDPKIDLLYDEDYEEVRVALSEHATISLVDYLGHYVLRKAYWVDLLSRKGVGLLVIDDVDQGLGLWETKRLMKKAMDVSTQCIVTSIDPNIIAETMFYNVYHHKAGVGMVSLQELCSKELRPAHNIEKLYRGHTFDGLIEVDDWFKEEV